MTPIQQLMLGVGAKKKTYMDDVFSTFLYDGIGGENRHKNNGIDLSGEGGMVWIKKRNTTHESDHNIFDTVRGAGKWLESNTSDAEGGTDTSKLGAFNNNGFTVGSDGTVNGNNHLLSSWTFRKAPGFFDVVSYTGNGANTWRDHSLGSVPGLIMVKCTSEVQDWTVWHRDLASTSEYRSGYTSGDFYLKLNAGNGRSSMDTDVWDRYDPTATQFKVGDSDLTNKNGATYVAYIFAGGASTSSLAKSVQFNGSTFGHAGLTLGTGLVFGTSDFCYETWAYLDQFPSNNLHASLADYNSSGANSFGWKVNDAGTLIFRTGNSTKISTTIHKKQWYHFALSRNGSTTTMYVNGTSVGSFTDTINYSSSFTTPFGSSNDTNHQWYGRGSNLRITIGEPVYTSNFKPSIEPLTTTSQGVTSSNVKVLCCNDSSVTGSTVSSGTLSTYGTVVSGAGSPFDDPAGFSFGAAGNQNTIATGSYTGDGGFNHKINIGWEPQFLIMKRIDSPDSWYMFDSMRGITTAGDDIMLQPHSSTDEGGINRLSLTPTGFELNSNNGDVNGNGGDYIYIAIRRPDPLVQKPQLATDVFAIDTGATSSTTPNFDSGFPVDWAILKNPSISQDWFAGARLIQGNYLNPNKTDADTANSGYSFDSNSGWNSGGIGSSYQSWMWKRHAGFDVVTYDGLTGGKDVPHSLGKIPEMYWIKSRSQGQDWNVYHSGMNGGSSPEGYMMILNGTMAENNAGGSYWNAPTSTHLRLKSANAISATGYQYIAMLFASVDGISKVGSYSGTGVSSGHTITTGFTPRFILIKNVTNANSWIVYDSVRGLSTGNDDPQLKLESNVGHPTQAYDTFSISSTGFTIIRDWGSINASSNNYIYYAHA